MEHRSLRLTLLLSLFFPHLVPAAGSSSAFHSPSPSSLDSLASPPSSDHPATPPRAAFGLPPPKQLDFVKPPIPPARRNVSRTPHRPSCSSHHLDCQHPKRELNFAERLGLFFIGVAAVLQVVLGTFLVYKRIQLKKAERRIQREMASSSSSSGPST